MAQVARDPQLAARIDDYLAYLQDAWAGVPEVAAEWPEWDSNSRLTFRLNWGVPADRLAQLQGWATQDQLTAAQRDRYDELLRLVAQHRPAVERLLSQD
jgi:hypothetical protein